MADPQTVDLSSAQPGASLEVRPAAEVTHGQFKAVTAAAAAPEERREDLYLLGRIRALVARWTARTVAGADLPQPPDLTLEHLDAMPRLLVAAVLRATDAEWRRLTGQPEGDQAPNAPPASS